MSPKLITHLNLVQRLRNSGAIPPSNMSSRCVQGKVYCYHPYYCSAIWVTEFAAIYWRECDKLSRYTKQLRSAELPWKSTSKTNTAFIGLEISLVFIAQIIRPLQSHFSNWILMLSTNVPKTFSHRSIFSLLCVTTKISFVFLSPLYVIRALSNLSFYRTQNYSLISIMLIRNRP